jgi:hypothetical protein
MTNVLNLDEYVFNINSLELASDLAHERLLLEYNDKMPIYNEEAGELRYTDDAQDIFDHYYDYYLTIIESCKVQLEIKN